MKGAGPAVSHVRPPHSTEKQYRNPAFKTITALPPIHSSSIRGGGQNAGGGGVPPIWKSLKSINDTLVVERAAATLKYF